MTSVPTRLQILIGLTDLLKTITPGNGYNSDLSDYADNTVTRSRVFRGRNIFGADDPLPMVSILEMPREPHQMETAPGGTAQAGPWELMIQGFVTDDLDNPTDPAHVLMADVKTCLIKERAKRGGQPGTPSRSYALLGRPQVTDIVIAPGVVRPPEEVSAKAFFWLICTLEIVEDPTNPFA